MDAYLTREEAMRELKLVVGRVTIAEIKRERRSEPPPQSDLVISSRALL
jgi:hypothetical protein